MSSHEPPPPDTDLGSRFEEALRWASELHRGQSRKGRPVPYVAHLLAVCAFVLEAGGDEDEAIAALLHDAVEDQGGAPILEEIRVRFGERVAQIVDGCTDAYEIPKGPWRQRKQDFIDSLEAASDSIHLVVAADKLHNSRSTVESLRAEGPDVWPRFRGKERAMWYYTEVAAALERRGDNLLLDRLRRTLDLLDTL